MLGLIQEGFNVVIHHRFCELFEVFYFARLNGSNTPSFAIKQSNVFAQNLDPLIFLVGHYLLLINLAQIIAQNWVRQQRVTYDNFDTWTGEFHSNRLV